MAHRHKKHEENHEALDLDLTPFLNILFMLILSILAMTSWTQLAMLNVQAPQIGGDGGGGDGSDEPPASTLNLTVFVLANGFNIASSGATLDGNSEGRPGEPLIPMVQKKAKDGSSVQSYDYARLTQKLIEIKKTFPGEESMIISADGSTPYEVIVNLMDASRRTADGAILFPSVAFAAGVVG